MKEARKIFRWILIALFLPIAGSAAYGQSDKNDSIGLLKVFNTVQVLHALSMEPVGDVRVTFVRDGLLRGRELFTAKSDGSISFENVLKNKDSYEIIILDKQGFTSLSKAFQPFHQTGDTIKIYLQPTPYEIPTVTVVGKKKKYSSVNNPAHDLAMRVGAEERKRRNEQVRNYTYRQIDNVMISAANIDRVQNFLQTVLPFYPSYLIDSKVEERKILPLSSRETVRYVGYNAKKKEKNEEIRYKNIIGVDENIDDGSLSMTLRELFPSVDLFRRYIHMLDTEIPSPLSDVGRFHYKYYLTDTIVYRKKLAQVIDVLPQYPSVPSFRGSLIVSMDSIPRLLRSELSFPRFSNINFIEQMRLIQNYDEVYDGEWHLKDEEIVANVRMFHNVFMANVDQVRRYDQYEFETPDSLLVHAKIQYVDRSEELALKAYRDQLRQQRLLHTDENLNKFLDQLSEHPTHRFLWELADIFSTDYIRTRWNRNLVFGGSLFEIGPVNQLVNYDSYRGLRLLLGGRTTALLNNQNFLEGYTAYSFGTKRFSYMISGKHSFRPKRYYADEYPRHDIALTLSNELYSPSKRYEYPDGSNLLYNVGEQHLTHYSYRQTFQAKYHYDLNSELSIQVFYELATDYPSGELEYVRVLKDGSIIRYEFLRDAFLGAEIRWSPGDRIFEGSMQRQNWYQQQRYRYPVFSFLYEHADPRLGGQYYRVRTELTTEQKLALGAFGRLDYRINIGKIWSAVPFPYLYTPPLNRSFGIRRYSFKLLKRSEYVADEWMTLFTEYHMRGVIANRIPLVKELKLRGVLTFNMLLGNTNKINRQEFADELFVLPNFSTEMRYSQPYMEVGFGLENILEVFRVDVFRRITPLGPHSDGPWGIKMDINLHF